MQRRRGIAEREIDRACGRDDTAVGCKQMGGSSNSDVRRNAAQHISSVVSQARLEASLVQPPCPRIHAKLAPADAHVPCRCRLAILRAVYPTEHDAGRFFSSPHNAREIERALGTPSISVTSLQGRNLNCARHRIESQRIKPRVREADEIAAGSETRESQSGRWCRSSSRTLPSMVSRPPRRGSQRWGGRNRPGCRERRPESLPVNATIGAKNVKQYARRSAAVSADSRRQTPSVCA